jgi:hypothetical protein
MRYDHDQLFVSNNPKEKKKIIVALKFCAVCEKTIVAGLF